MYDAVDRRPSSAPAPATGPTLVEAETYRWKGHSKSDKNLYRTREEIAEWRERDPILRFEAPVARAGTLSDEDIQRDPRRRPREAIRERRPRRQRRPRRRADDLLDAVFAEPDR